MSTTKAYFKTIESVASQPENALVLVGTALDGPSNRPFIPSSVSGIEDIIGDCPLSKAYLLASRTGLENIVLYRLNGTHATGELNYNIAEVMSFVSVAASDAYNDIVIDVGPDKLSATSIDGTTRDYFFINYPSAGMMADALNLDASYGLLEFNTYVADPTFQMSLFDDHMIFTVLFSGGSTEADLCFDRRTPDLTVQIATLEQRLTSALFGDNPDDQASREPNSILGLMEYGIICLVDMFHDDPAKFTELLSQFCQNKGVAEGRGCMGVIGVNPIIGTITDAGLVAKAVSLKSKAPNMGTSAAVETNNISTANPMSYVQIVIGDTQLNAIFNEDAPPVSLAPSYAATQAFLSYDTSMTNKALVGVTYLNYEFEKKDLEELLANGYISIVSSIRKGFVPYYAITGIGNKTSLLKSPNIVRITQAVTKKVADYLDDYIGTTGSSMRRSGIENGVGEVLRDFKEANIIRDYKATFEYAVLNGDAKVSLSIVPYSSVGTVNSIVNLPFR